MFFTDCCRQSRYGHLQGGLTTSRERSASVLMNTFRRIKDLLTGVFLCLSIFSCRQIPHFHSYYAADVYHEPVCRSVIASVEWLAISLFGLKSDRKRPTFPLTSTFHDDCQPESWKELYSELFKSRKSGVKLAAFPNAIH